MKYNVDLPFCKLQTKGTPIFWVVLMVVAWYGCWGWAGYRLTTFVLHVLAANGVKGL